MVLEKQLTILFHIDDVMMRHKSTCIITDYIKLLDQKYGSNDPLIVTRRKIYEYLGMTLDFRQKGSMAFT